MTGVARGTRAGHGIPVGITAALMLSASACAPSADSGADSAGADAAGDAMGDMVVDVVARELTLDAPDSVPSGWTTFRFTNTAPMVHFVLVDRMPEGTGIAEHQELLAPVFQQAFELSIGGQPEAAMAAFASLPPWFAEVVFMGGPGLTAPGHTSQATVFLEPGTYVLECYVKTDGVFHAYNPDPNAYGMVHELTVTERSGGAPEPTATLRLAISSDRGISMEGEPSPGRHTVAVQFVDQIVHENLVGHDVHLARLAEDTDLEELALWMDSRRPDGLQDPAPAEFLGGTNELPAGTTGYFTVDLEPGRYAWIAEVPGSADKGMLVPFSVGQ